MKRVLLVVVLGLVLLSIRLDRQVEEGDFRGSWLGAGRRAKGFPYPD